MTHCTEKSSAVNELFSPTFFIAGGSIVRGSIAPLYNAACPKSDRADNGLRSFFFFGGGEEPSGGSIDTGAQLTPKKIVDAITISQPLGFTHCWVSFRDCERCLYERSNKITAFSLALCV